METKQEETNENQYLIKEGKIKIHMENEGRKLYNKIVPLLIEKSKKYINQDIKKANGELLKKVNDDFKPLLNEDDYKKDIVPLTKEGKVSLSLYLHTTDHNTYLNIKLCFNGGSYDDRTYYCIYYEKIAYIIDYDYKTRWVTANDSILNFQEQKILNEEEEIKRLLFAEQKRKEYEKARDCLYYGLRSLIK